MQIFREQDSKGITTSPYPEPAAGGEVDTLPTPAPQV